jgi:hypothetical protein
MKTLLDIPRPVQLDGYSCGFIAATTILKGKRLTNPILHT